MNLALGTVLTRRILVILAVLLPLLMLGVQGLRWHDEKTKALIAARDDAIQIDTEARDDLAAPGPRLATILAYRQVAGVIANEAADTRKQGGCNWQRDNRLVFVFEASGAPLREPTAQGATGFPGSSIPGVMESALASRGIGFGRSSPEASLAIHAGDGACLVDGTAVGVLIKVDGGALAALRLVAFDWGGYWELLLYAYGALGIFGLLAELVTWQFNVALNRRISRITSVLEIVEQNEFSDRVPVDGGPEFRRLGEAINAMIVRLGVAHRYFADLNSFVAHNLRSPIIVARALVENLANTPGPDTSSMLPELDMQLLKLDQQCNELLDRAELGPIRSEPADLASTVTRQVDDIFSYLAQEKDMSVELSLSPATVLMPRAKQELIIDNLLQNALKFGESGTSIRVRVETRDRKASLCVTNRGPSVPPERFQQILERGVTDGGHGLGLYAVKTAAMLYGGEVVVLPQHDGFCILVTLPLAQSQQLK